MVRVSLRARIFSDRRLTSEEDRFVSDVAAGISIDSTSREAVCISFRVIKSSSRVVSAVIGWVIVSSSVLASAVSSSSVKHNMEIVVIWIRKSWF